jgi:hypothetical protein
MHRNRQICLLLCGCIVAASLSGCYKAPLELRTALEKQAKELAQISSAYNENIDHLLTALEGVQLDYLKQAEDQLRTKYAYEGKIGEKAGAGSDPDLLIIRLASNKKISDYFSQKRDQVHKNFADKRKEFMKLQQSIDNASAVNQAMSDYVDSLIRLRKAEDTFGKTLLTRISTVVPVPAISPTVIDEVIRVTNQEVDKFLKDNPKDIQAAN